MLRINYKGMDSNYKYRVAEINFSEDEEPLYLEIEKIMHQKGYVGLYQVTNNYALYSLDDYNEYKEFVKEYKKAKRQAKEILESKK